jgi:arsenical pump membrane protein
MTLPWLATIGVEWLVLRRFFASDLVGRGEVVAEPQPGGAPRTAVVVLALRGRRAHLIDLGRAVTLLFLAFVAALGWWCARSPTPGWAGWSGGSPRTARGPQKRRGVPGRQVQCQEYRHVHPWPNGPVAASRGLP